MNGGPLAGRPIGTQPEQPLRWSGRLALSTSLIVNALAGGAIVAMLFMVGMRLTGNARASMLMAVVAGLATPAMTEATHFFHHAITGLMLLTGFWFFIPEKSDELERRGLALGIALLARPDATVAGTVLWGYGAIAAWRMLASAPDRWARMIRLALLAGVGPAASAAGYLYYNYLRFGGLTQFGYTDSKERLAIHAAQNAQAIIAYLLSPSLSLFLFAPPLILAFGGGTMGVSAMAVGVRGADCGRHRAATFVLVLRELERRCGLRAEIHVRGDRDAHAADAAGVRGRRRLLVATGNDDRGGAGRFRFSGPANRRCCLSDGQRVVSRQPGDFRQ
jgi:hypothetical protein